MKTMEKKMERFVELLADLNRETVEMLKTGDLAYLYEMNDTVEEFYSIQNGSKEELLAGIDNQAQEIYKNFNALAEMAGEVGERDWTEEESSLAFELLQCIFNANVEIINAYGLVD